MSTDQFDPEQVVRIRLRVAGAEEPKWSGRMRRAEAEMDVHLGRSHLEMEHAEGVEVESAAIVPWTFD